MIYFVQVKVEEIQLIELGGDAETELGRVEHHQVGNLNKTSLTRVLFFTGIRTKGNRLLSFA